MTRRCRGGTSRRFLRREEVVKRLRELIGRFFVARMVSAFGVVEEWALVLSEVEQYVDDLVKEGEPEIVQRVVAERECDDWAFSGSEQGRSVEVSLLLVVFDDDRQSEEFECIMSDRALLRIEPHQFLEAIESCRVCFGVLEKLVRFHGDRGLGADGGPGLSARRVLL